MNRWCWWFRSYCPRWQDESCWEHLHKSQHATRHAGSQATKDHQRIRSSPTEGAFQTNDLQWERDVCSVLSLPLTQEVNMNLQKSLFIFSLTTGSSCSSYWYAEIPAEELPHTNSLKDFNIRPFTVVFVCFSVGSSSSPRGRRPPDNRPRFIAWRTQRSFRSRVITQQQRFWPGMRNNWRSWDVSQNTKK